MFTEVKERPILFSAPMVRALLVGTKTQTRRVVKKPIYVSHRTPPNCSDTKPGDVFVCPDMLGEGLVLAEATSLGTYHCMGQKPFAAKYCPYGQPGDLIWVRETFFCATGGVNGGPDLNHYRADGDHPEFKGLWKPSIFMPRWASRITLRITDVRVERLQDISEQDAIAEGCEMDGAFPREQAHPKGGSVGWDDAREWYAYLWESINGAGSWDVNPWVWAISFERQMPEVR